MISKRKRVVSRKKGNTAAAPPVEALLAQVAPVVEIQHVRLLGGTFEAVASEEQPRPDPIRFSSSFQLNVDARILECRLQFDFLARVPAVAPPHRIVRVAATHLVTYLVREGHTPSVEALTAFSQINAAYNAWPYWREFLQSALQRLELPPFVAPLLRFGQIEHNVKVGGGEPVTKGTKK